MSTQYLDQIEEVVYQALENKYPVSSSVLRRDVISPLVLRLGTLPFNELPEVTIKVGGVRDEVYNQIITLIRLNEDWAQRPTADIDLEMIHQGVFGGAGGSATLRTTEYVADFDGKPPTALTDLEGRLEDINQRLSDLDKLRDSSVDKKCAFLANLFSSIIATHVFVDGNGRTARVSVQYCLRRWGMDFIALPKVRNAVKWKLALHTAIAGDINPFVSYFSYLLSGKTYRQIEKLLDDDQKNDSDK